MLRQRDMIGTAFLRRESAPSMRNYVRLLSDLRYAECLAGDADRHPLIRQTAQHGDAESLAQTDAPHARQHRRYPVTASLRRGASSSSMRVGTTRSPTCSNTPDALNETRQIGLTSMRSTSSRGRPGPVVLISAPVADSKTAMWDQRLSAGAPGMPFSTVAHAEGFLDS